MPYIQTCECYVCYEDVLPQNFWLNQKYVGVYVIWVIEDSLDKYLKRMQAYALSQML
ncbi:hypothetical protein XSR1_130025 [Xenorhabdus szentirmaii DSM 16338]|uniref:Uncharacterized protein n=1 Tax=Xenorhabdus szentirmaii DSM 16338 TaxID=1427518 RepID=W1IW48_9GAMM|nr:hypothetical protein Xsze_00271 [Xenorhabdus szentirmaii DSM 16338]CDL81420.1 hypothetical protein XSR1_130025 [Xenorhabdus szentirmaii DSM 16338]